MAKLITYKGYRILITSGLFCTLGTTYKTLAKAKEAIDNTIKQIRIGIY